MNGDNDLINNEEWLRGYQLYEDSFECPWERDARLGWLDARANDAIRKEG